MIVEYLSANGITFNPVTLTTPLPVTITSGGGGATGPGTAATATRVTYASDGATVLVKAASYTQLGYQQITAATLAASTALTVPGGATTAIVQNNTT